MHKKRLLPLCIALIASGQLHAQTTSSSQELVEEVEVTGVRAAELNAREEERSKNIFSSVISQDDAGKFADQNVAESLQRLPGITLQKSEGEGQFVSVRGLGPGFVNVSMNGNELASSSSDTRAFALDAVPSDLLSSIEVFKSLTPDMDLNSIGGTVNVKTVNAFDRKKDTLRVTGQLSQQVYNGDTSPKISLQGTNLFADDTIGLGYSMSYEKRGTDGYLNVHHAEQDPTYRQQNYKNIDGGVPQGEMMLTPWQFEAKEEQAERERTAVSVDLGWRPNEESDYYIRYTRTSLEDLDIALREYYRFDTASTAEQEVPYIDTTTGTFGVTDAELQQQFFIQKGEAVTDAFEIGGKNTFDEERWKLDYNYSSSKGEYSKPDGRRVQFRIQDLPMLGQAGEDYIAAQIISPADMANLAGTTVSNLVNTGGYFLMDTTQRKQGGMTYDNIFIEDSFRTDTLDQFSMNLRRDFDEGFLNYIKTGFVMKDRERDRNKDRWSIVPGNYPNACDGDAVCDDLRNSSLADFETYTPNHPDIQYDFITRSEAERLLDATSRIAKYTDPNLTGQESRKEDYLLTEESQAAYVMVEFQTSENSTLITGVRYENTDFSSDGYLAIRNDRFTETDNAENSNLDIAIPLQDTKSSYDDLFPSIHYRYDMADDMLVRASLWTSFTRPSFDQARAYGEVVGRVVLCNPDTNVCNDNPPANGGIMNDQQQIVTAGGTPFTMASGNTLEIGNPNLVAMTSVNFDTSISWYGENGDSWQVAAFYKEIDDFIVGVRGAEMSVADLPMALPFDQVTQFAVPSDLVIDRVNFATNGETAEVYGVELSYSKYFESGWFVQTNMTLMDSKANVGDTLRVGTIKLPEQADQTINLSVGWEGEALSARLIGNYRSEILKRVGACNADAIAEDAVLGYAENCRTWADVYQDASPTLDFKGTYAFNKALQFSLDITNLTGEVDTYYFSGNEDSGGKMLFNTEDYGSTYLLGVSYKFM
ncbi:TonB-dependent receptor [Cellvibrio sp. NN19]|uniref:TonB-dependent receptor n=1 Tax=Cellvibrio chitinivorans TaxID=3102792 RepID=UPI002B415DA2|nr:TonB-dependent receptor [Cellvibrio sp. NN19]